MKRLFSIALLCSLAIGCDKKPENKPEKSDKSAEKAKSEKPQAAKKVRIRGLAPDTPRSRGEEIPTSEDFEEEASRTVALENLDAELDRLEAEIVAQSP